MILMQLKVLLKLRVWKNNIECCNILRYLAVSYYIILERSCITVYSGNLFNSCKTSICLMDHGGMDPGSCLLPTIHTLCHTH